MKKEYLKIGIALLLLFGIAIPLSMHREKEIKKAVAEDESKKFITFDFGTIQRVQITNKTGDVVLERRKKDASGKSEDEFEARNFEYKDRPEWIVTRPSRGLVDPMLLESFFSQIKDMAYQKVIQDTQERKKDYDLDPATLSLRFFEADASEPKLTISMGSENPASSGFYFLTSDKPGIYLGERSLQPFQNQKPDQWIEKRILGIPNATELLFAKVEQSGSKKDSFEVTRDNGVWKFGPTKDNLLADVAAITNFADQVDNMRAIEILTDESIVKNAQKIAHVDLKFKNNKDPVSFTVFKDPKDSNLFYIQRSDVKGVYKLGFDPKILSTSHEMVSKKLLDASFSDISTIKVIRPNGAVEMVNENQVWKVKKPYEDDANPRRLDSVIKAISELKPSAYLPNKILNSKNQMLRLEYSLLENKGAGAVSFYREGKSVYVSAEGATKTRTFLISQVPPDIHEHLGHLRNDDLVPVSDEHVKRIVFSKGQGRVEIEQNVNKHQWFLKTLEGVPSTVSMKWKEEVTPEEFFNRAFEMYIVNFMDRVDPAVKYETATLDIISDQDRQYTWKFGEKKGGFIGVYSPDRKIAATMAWDKYQELASLLEEPKKTDKK